MAHSSDALEKKLRAVYDAFDQRNHKGAIKLCNAGLQKHPQCWTFKSLKAVALQRSGKQQEALQLAEEVLAAAPPDDHVLNMLLLVLKPAHRAHELAAAYEAAWEKQQHNQELLQGLFGCHVRSFSYAAQQQVAMRLNKLHPSELYQWWVVTSLALQAHAAAVRAQLAPAAAQGSSSSSSDAKGGLGADKLLALAEAMAGRLLAKAPAQGGGHGWESIMMYLGLLQAQGKYTAALEAVRGPLGASISLPAERREAEAALLLAQGDLAAAAELYQAAVQEQPDDWALLLLYLDCMLPGTASSHPACCSTAVAQMVTGVEASTRPGFQTGGVAALLAAMNVGDASQPSLPDRIAAAEAFISSLAAAAAAGNNDSSVSHASPSEQPTSSSSSSSNSNSASGVLRGPTLAHVELAKRKLQLGVGSQQQLVDALLTYHDRFGHLVSCAMDVFCYLEQLSDSSRQQLSTALAARVQQAADDFQQQQQQPDSSKALTKLLRRQMSARQIQKDIGEPRFSSASAAAQHAQQLLQLYAAALPLYQGLDERERGPADELLWQAAEALITAASLPQCADSSSRSDSNSSSSGCVSMQYLLQALLVLEAAAKGRPYCAPVRLGLTALHGLLGNAAGAAHHFGVLDVKHVQHDTLSSHHLLPLLVGLQDQPRVQALLEPMCALFENHLEDAGDTLMQAYRHGTHTKVLEFVCFKERLERSHTFVLARAERAILSIAAAAAEGGPALSSAAAAAVQDLPLALLDDISWQGMHFNDDYTTRLPWMPPVHGPRQLVVLLWWEQQQQQCQQCQQQQQPEQAGGQPCSSGSAACWWRQVAAAEADQPAAAALRESMKAAAQQRWLLPHLLHAALAAATSSTTSPPSPSSSSSDTSSLLQLLHRLAAALGYSSTAQSLNDVLEEAFGTNVQPESGASSSSSQVPLSGRLQLLDAGLFTLAGSLQAMMHTGAAEVPHPALNGCAAQEAHITRCAARLSAALQQLTDYFRQELQPARSYQGCLMSGQVLSAAALLLSEGVSWIVSCLEAWFKALKHSKKKKGGKAHGEAAADVEHAMEQLAVPALAQVADAARLLLEEVQLGCQRCQQACAATSALLAEFDDSSSAAIKALTGWEQRMSAQLVLTDLVQQQRRLLSRLQETSGKLSRRLQVALS